MSTLTPVTLNDSTYTQISNAVDQLITNEGPATVDIIFAASQPADSDVGHSLTREDRGIQKIAGNPSGDSWGKIRDPGRPDQKVIVST